jgi:hypothetical protein
LGGFKITSLGAGTAATDAAQYGQLQAGATTIATVTGTDTYVGTLSPAIAFASGINSSKFKNIEISGNKFYKLKNNICAFRNIMGGVSAVINGRVEEITNLQDAEYEIYGNKVLVKLFNKSIIVFSNGKKFTN